MLDVSSLAKAVAQLEKSLRFLRSEPIQRDPDLRGFLRAATIQAFEFTYDLSVKMVRRQLDEIELSPEETRQMAFLDLMRAAADAGLVRDAPVFRRYRALRNITSHTYDEVKADEVLAGVEPFLEDARFILGRLSQRNR